MTTPLASIGIPTRNGARTLAVALKSALRQNYPNLEIVISDNASDDETAEVVRDCTQGDPRTRYTRQPHPVTMLENHRRVWEAARGEYFMWLADDDLLSDDFVSGLVGALEAQPDAVLAFGEMTAFSDYRSFADDVPFDYYDFSTRGMPGWRRLWRKRHGGYEVKGVFRHRALEGFKWYPHTVSPDWPILTYLFMSGEVIRVPGVTLHNGSSAPESGSDRARTQAFASIERFPTATLSWRSALAARDAAARRGERRWPLLDACLTFVSILRGNRRYLLTWAMEPLTHRMSGRARR